MSTQLITTTNIHIPDLPLPLSLLRSLPQHLNCCRLSLRSPWCLVQPSGTLLRHRRCRRHATSPSGRIGAVARRRAGRWTCRRSAPPPPSSRSPSLVNVIVVVPLPLCGVRKSRCWELHACGFMSTRLVTTSTNTPIPDLPLPLSLLRSLPQHLSCCRLSLRSPWCLVQPSGTLLRTRSQY
jgi:hypothetical protein